MNIEKTIFELLTENTGESLGDSGGAYGRNYERNKKKTISEFKSEAEVFFDCFNPEEKAEEIPFPTVSVFHYLTNVLEIDNICEEFNKKQDARKWDGLEGGAVGYGEETEIESFFEQNGLSIIGEWWNSYNGESNLSQTLQGLNISTNSSDFEFPKYVLLQIHGGCDVRGGYTVPKMFKIKEFSYFSGNPCVYTELETKRGKIIELSTAFDGYNLTTDEGEEMGPEELEGFTEKELAEMLTERASFDQ